MRIQMLTLWAGPAGVREIGAIYEVPAREARDLVDGGWALAVTEQPTEEPTETDDTDASEKTAPRRARRRHSAG